MNTDTIRDLIEKREKAVDYKNKSQKVVDYWDERIASIDKKLEEEVGMGNNKQIVFDKYVFSWENLFKVIKKK